MQDWADAEAMMARAWELVRYRFADRPLAGRAPAGCRSADHRFADFPLADWGMLQPIAEQRSSAVRRVNEVIDGWRQRPDPAGDGAGVALVAAHRSRLVGTLHDAFSSGFARVLGAADGPTAVGLAIVCQPDVAVVDEDLLDVDGLDTSCLVRVYAPATRVVLVARHRGSAARSRQDGVATVMAPLAEGRRGLTDDGRLVSEALKSLS